VAIILPPPNFFFGDFVMLENSGTGGAAVPCAFSLLSLAVAGGVIPTFWNSGGIGGKSVWVETGARGGVLCVLVWF
jgi:hypothetical protein